jgi:farnesyl diphosphate synthase
MSTTAQPTSSTIKALSKAEKRQRFEDAFVVIREELLEHFAGQGMPAEGIEWYKRNLDYNVPGGKLNRGLSVVDSFEILRDGQITEDEWFKAAVLGWCVELLQAYFLVVDDIMDQSHTRRSQPCYFRLPSVGNIAINDSIMLEAAIFHLLKKWFRKDKNYVDILELFLDTTYQTEMGQMIDLITAPEDHVDLSKFSLEKHRLIVVYKTAFYSFYLPIALAMLMAGIPAPPEPVAVPNLKNLTSDSNKIPTDPYEIAMAILVPLGEYFQVQDDYLDAFGTPEQIGKVGTDIVDNKCSWCICTALSLASPAQRQILDENYGVKPPAGVDGTGPEGLGESERKVKEVYRELRIEERYKEYERNYHQRITSLVDQIDEEKTGLKKEAFTGFLAKIFGRTK